MSPVPIVLITFKLSILILFLLSQFLFSPSSSLSSAIFYIHYLEMSPLGELTRNWTVRAMPINFIAPTNIYYEATYGYKVLKEHPPTLYHSFLAKYFISVTSLSHFCKSIKGHEKQDGNIIKLESMLNGTTIIQFQGFAFNE